MKVRATRCIAPALLAVFSGIAAADCPPKPSTTSNAESASTLKVYRAGRASTVSQPSERAGVRVYRGTKSVTECASDEAVTVYRSGIRQRGKADETDSDTASVPPKTSLYR